MNHNSNIALIGGDRRQFYIGDFFNSKGFNIYTYALNCGFNKCCLLEEIMRKCDIIVLPVPAFKDNHFINNCHDSTVLISDFISHLQPGKHIIFGGCFNDEICRIFDTTGAAYYDFMKDNGVAWLNSIATAEGTIMEAIKESPKNLHYSNCLVTGFGRCAQVLADKLTGLNGHVTIACRKKDAMYTAKSMGYDAISIGDNISYTDMINCAPKFDFVFNTVPAMIIDTPFIDGLKKDCLIMDIASYPGGTDFEYARKKGIKAILALSIPGRVSPLTSGRILAECIENYLG